MEETQITTSEWEVMRVIWTLETASAQDVIDSLSAQMDWKAATIKTLLGRLVKKEILATTQEGKKFIYSAKVNEQTTVQNALNYTLKHVCTTKRGQTIKDLINQVDLSKEDIALLTQALKEKTPKVVKCSCIKGQCTCCTHRKEEEI